MLTVQRRCCRCQLDLTDPVSLEIGIGPVCRKRDNALLARTMPVDQTALCELWPRLIAAQAVEADAATTSVSAKHVFGWLARFSQVLDGIKAATTSPEADCRETVRSIEFVLSWLAPRSELAELLVEACEQLGYVGLAETMRGNAAAGKAVVYLADGRLIVTGPRGPGFRGAVKAIEGRRFHAAASLGPLTDKAAWSVPAMRFEALRAAVVRFYPCHELAGGLTWDELGVRARALTMPSRAGSPLVEISIEARGPWLLVKTPYDPRFLAQVKALPYRDRKWDGPSKAWLIDAKHEKRLNDIVEQVYGAGWRAGVAV